MDQETTHLLSHASAVAVAAHLLVRRYGWACLATIVVAPLIYVVESALRLNLPLAKLSWLPMVYPFLMLYSLAPAVLIGVPFLTWRRMARRVKPRS